MTTQDANFRIFTSKDAIPGALAGERIAVLGYGHLGQPFALNLRDSGAGSILVGNIADDYASQAQADGFSVQPIGEATRQADLVLVLLPDEVIPDVFAKDVLANLQPGAAVVFASGYTLAYGLIQPPADVDVLMLAPRMAGENARQRFLNQQGFYAYVSVEQEASGKAWQRLLGLAEGVGVLRAGAVQLNAQQEADLDLLVEQTVGAVLGVSIMSTFALGLDYNIPPEALVLEMYMSGEMEMVWRSFREQGFFKGASVHGPTALYGGFIRTMQFMQTDLGDRFREIMDEIHSGQFARQFQAEREAGYPLLSQAEEMTMDESPQALAEKRLRQMLSDK